MGLPVGRAAAPDLATRRFCCPSQVDTIGQADRIINLGLGRVAGTCLIVAWAVVLVATIVVRRHTDYAGHEALFWWEAFYRTGSIIFGGGQVGKQDSLLHTSTLQNAWFRPRGGHIKLTKVVRAPQALPHASLPELSLPSL